MPEVPPYPCPSQIPPHRATRRAILFALAGALSLVSVLWSCKPEQPATAPGPKGAMDNHPPSILSARIFPPDVAVGTELRVETQSEDADGDRVTYRYQWLVNGVPAETEPAFRLVSLKKGDRITADVIPNDGKVDGPVFRTLPVTVGNGAPYIIEIHLEPVPLHRGEQLTVKVVAEDPDGDPVTLTYKWFHNNKEIAGAKSETLDTKDFQKKDVLEVMVTPSDGKSTREGQGLPVTIQNSPPRFTSTPPTEIKDGRYLYQVAVTDSDGDPVTLELKQGPPGMTLDPATKQLSWKLTPENLGKHHVVLVAKDNDDGATQLEFDLDAQPPAQAAKP